MAWYVVDYQLEFGELARYPFREKRSKDDSNLVL